MSITRYQRPSLQMPNDQLLAWIGNRGKRCTAGEAAAQTGLPLAAVETHLLALAVEAGGRLQVGENGTIFYSYPPQLRGRLLARSWRRRLLAAARRGVLLMTRLIRLSFGVVLVVVTSLVVMAVMVVLIVRLLNSEKGGNIALSLLQALAQVPGSILQLLVSGLSTGSAGSGTTPTPAELWHLLWDLPGEGTAAGSMGFLSAVFSILFGDGHPNARLEEIRWRRIVGFLRLHGGAVIAEDLAPLLELPPCPDDRERARDLADAAMLPVLLRFDGRPEVSEDGELIHRFPELPTMPTEGSVPVAPAPPLRERRFRFSRAGQEQRIAYGIVVTALLVLSPVLLGPTPSWLPPLAWLARFAIGYSVLLLLVPLMRLPLLRWRNRSIAVRNARRQSWAWAAGEPSAQRQQLRTFARSFAPLNGDAGMGAATIVYDSGVDLLEQSIEDLRDTSSPE
ncbi:hypothetical protein KBY93_11025 [Synechococcus sp. J7-Johnson]|uniref:hypothetical protein n=1 Tax=Synechococcus sp. J7-Johnson TaxID=2823737 RepID=UPI0020CD2B65|nr:hypothetical protein [Synechococcus sp. J7-Johnson]MCP9841159.1 hypothetical protein [Synechococcus sp. J7-Johnson]